MRLEFSTSAKNDFRQIKQHYKAIDPMLSRRFQAAVEKCSKRMQVNPNIMQQRPDGNRRWPVGDSFPHGIFYRILADKIAIFAIFHPKRSPEELSRLSSQ